MASDGTTRRRDFPRVGLGGRADGRIRVDE